MAEIIEIPQNNPDSILNRSPEEVLAQLLNISDENTEEMSVLFTQILAIPDEEFKSIAPVLSDTYNRSLKDSNNLIMIAQAMNMNGTKLEDIHEMIETLSEEIDKFDESQLSAVKKDFFKNLANGMYNALTSVEGIAKRYLKVPIELCRPEAKIPQYAHLTDAGADIYAVEDTNIQPGETKIVPLGFKLAPPPGYAVLIHPRSGLSAKTKMRVANSIGLCDSDYKDEYGIILENIEPRIKDLDLEFNEETGTYTVKSVLYGETVHITQGERIGQLRLVEVPKMSFYEVDDINIVGEDRGGGFGSTGQN